MSLRWRLAAGLGILLAAGLVVFGITTYSLYAPTQWTQLDSQLTKSIGPIAQRLERRAHLSQPDNGPPASQPNGGAGGSGVTGTGGSPRGDSGRGAATTASHQPGGHNEEPPVALEPGSYGVLVSPSGKVVKRYQVSSAVGVPRLGPLIARARSQDHPGTPVFATVPSVGKGPTWRAIASGAPGAPRYVVAVAIPTTAVNSGLHHLLLVEAEVGGGLLLVLLAGAWLILARGLRPLEQMADRSRSIAAGNLSQRVGPENGPSEVVELGTALDTMLDDLERAFAEREETEARLRQFLADASHELRTPLTSIQGFAELFRLSSEQRRPNGNEASSETLPRVAPASLGDGDGPETINPAAVDPETVARRIEDESKRMKRLVDDLLLLARLDQVSELQAEQLDLAVLVADACAAAVASQPGRPVTLDAPEPVVVTGDGAHLRQAVGNLLANALKHTPAETPVDVSVAAVPPSTGGAGAAVVVVRDHGPGLGAEGLAHAFDRFWRGDAARAGEGAGLGLSIVSAIAREHNGTVSAADAPDGGAIFTLTIERSADTAPLQHSL